MTTAPFTSHFQMCHPGPNGITLKAASAVNAESTGALMYRTSTAVAGKKLSLRISLTRSAIGCSRPNGPARFGP